MIGGLVVYAGNLWLISKEKAIRITLRNMNVRIKKLSLLSFCFALLLICSGCSGEHRKLDVGEALCVNAGEGRMVLLARKKDSISLVYFRNKLDELGLEITDEKIEIQRKEVVNGETFMTISDSGNLIPKIRLQLGNDGNIKRKEIISGWKFQEVGSGNQE